MRGRGAVAPPLERRPPPFNYPWVGQTLVVVIGVVEKGRSFLSETIKKGSFYSQLDTSETVQIAIVLFVSSCESKLVFFFTMFTKNKGPIRDPFNNFV